ncbi:TPA: hypothetical protein ACGIK9_002818 [Acinetobacter baumannii]|uniref:hypothetical protein n=1 Tax=Acinetobacter baumannii TaxID=470 RepID=UPI00338F969C
MSKRLNSSLKCLSIGLGLVFLTACDQPLQELTSSDKEQIKMYLGTKYFNSKVPKIRITDENRSYEFRQVIKVGTQYSDRDSIIADEDLSRILDKCPLPVKADDVVIVHNGPMESNYDFKDRPIFKTFFACMDKEIAIGLGPANLQYLLNDPRIKDRSQIQPLRRVLDETKADKIITYPEAAKIYNTLFAMMDNESLAKTKKSLDSL